MKRIKNKRITQILVAYRCVAHSLKETTNCIIQKKIIKITLNFLQKPGEEEYYLLTNWNRKKLVKRGCLSEV